MKTKIITAIILSTIYANVAAQQCGCTDPLATNYDSTAVTNDGSCQYQNSSITPQTVGQLPPSLNGTSTLIFWDGGYWSCNDHTKLKLYRLDSLTGAITDSVTVSESAPHDMEEIAQDSLYLYFGDFGNNSNTRTDLQILRVEKTALLNGTHVIDTIFFSYPDQTDFTSSSMETDFDCEAFIASGDSLYLFTKQWGSQGTVCYALPKIPDTHVAERRDSCKVQGLVTGATLFEDENLLVLCGYSTLLQPFIYLLYDYNGDNFFSGNKRKININLLGSQIEAIASSNAIDYYLTNEKFTYSSITINATMHKIDLKNYLSNYLYGESETNVSINETTSSEVSINIFPNPSNGLITLNDPQKEIRKITIYDTSGKQVFNSNTEPLDNHHINISELKKGVYFIRMELNSRKFVKDKIVIE